LAGSADKKELNSIEEEVHSLLFKRDGKKRRKVSRVVRVGTELV